MPEIIPLVAHTIGFDPNWFIGLCTCMSFASFGSTVCFLLSKFLYRQYNCCRYGHSNKQYTDLTPSEIETIKSADWNLGDSHDIMLTDDNIKNIHSKMIKFIKKYKKTSDRQNLKTAHQRFRDGNVKYAILTQPPILVEIISEELLINRNDNTYGNLEDLAKYAGIPKWLKALKNRVKKVLNELEEFESVILSNYESPHSAPQSIRTSPTIHSSELDQEIDLEKGVVHVEMTKLN
jgi:hypothetical protein